MTTESNRPTAADVGFAASRNEAAQAPTTGTQATNHNHQTCSHFTTFAGDATHQDYRIATGEGGAQ